MPKKQPKMTTLIRYVYTIFIGLLLVTFVGVGIAAFYPRPKDPEYPQALQYPAKSVDETGAQNGQTDEQIKAQKDYDTRQKEFQGSVARYNRDVSIISLIAAIVVLVISLMSFKTIYFISDGLLLGGVMTLLYSIVSGFGSQDNMFRFLVVSIGLVVTVALGYIKFIKQPAFEEA